MTHAVFFPGLVPTTWSAIADYVTEDPAARDRFGAAGEVLGYDLAAAYATADVYDWEVYEAGFMALSLALADWSVRDGGLAPSVCGGQSFGSVVGAVFTGALSYEDGVRLVRDSVRVEQEWFEAQEVPLGCLFLYRLSEQAVDRLVQESCAAGRWAQVSVHLDNSVHAISGSIPTLGLIEQRVREEGGYPFYTMNRAEHCPAVEGLRLRLADEVYGRLTWHGAAVPMLSDVDGTLLTGGAEIRDDLLAGWTTPVHWSVIVGGLQEAGVERVHVVGPRSMFARITNGVLPTDVVTPKVVRAARRAA
jgi:[acyl-carrier-protein] S-malonyltransferase